MATIKKSTVRKAVAKKTIKKAKDGDLLDKILLTALPT